MSTVTERRSLLLVHAHPDDESIFTGATMARYAAEGVRVTLVTCTMGERGDNRLSSGPADNGGQLAKIRTDELEAACAALGVNDHRFLGGPGRWRDSSDKWNPRHNDARSFRHADIDEAASELAGVLREVRAQVVVTYADDGFYGHPDHVQAHNVAWRAYQSACDTTLTKFYAIAIPRSVLAEATRETPWSVDGHPPSKDVLALGLPDDQVTTEIEATGYLDAKLAALRAHATQVTVEGLFFDGVGLPARVLGTEYYTLLAGPGMPWSTSGAQGREDDLFSGLL